MSGDDAQYAALGRLLRAALAASSERMNAEARARAALYLDVNEFGLAYEEIAEGCLGDPPEGARAALAEAAERMEMGGA